MSTKGSYFKAIREQMHLSQEELARKMGTTRGTLVNLENGRTKIVTGSVLDFCKATGVSLLEVIDACYPTDGGGLLREDTQYKELLKHTVDEYEERLAAKARELKEKDERFSILQETVRAQRKLIDFYEQASDKKV